jgi:hypothetical protein
MDFEEGTEQQVAYRTLVSSLSERSLGYLQKMQKADFPYQHMSVEPSEMVSNVDTASAGKPSLRRARSATSMRESVSSLGSAPTFARGVSGAGMPAYMHTSKLMHAFSQVPNRSPSPASDF